MTPATTEEHPLSPELWKRVRRLLQVAIGQTPDQREAFLDDACADDVDLKREVESPLRVHDETKTFMASPFMRLAATRSE